MDPSTPAYKEIAPRLKGLRDAMDLTIEEMADQVRMPPEDVQRYESGEGEIPVSYLFTVAQTFQVDLTVLLSGDEAHLHGSSLVKSGKGMSVERRRDYDYKSLAYRFVGRKMEPFMVTVPPKSEEELTFTEHPGQEFIYMLNGRLEITIGATRHVMEPGDSLYFSSASPHALRALDGRNAEFLDVII
ncbi:MAG TPA: XRE family transcriptional regulator [Desulfomicrobiaceae bacterium]|jgi:transcriptional regulator with XRE-family HTH domain|nr:XRE family transcriptional regulator [Desulfomicrobiaceae bacterium]